MQYTLIDAGPICAYYNAQDDWHVDARKFFSCFKGQFVTTEPIVTEVLWQLQSDWRVQNEFLNDIVKKLYRIESLLPAEYVRLADLNQKYQDRPADFGDLSLIIVAERLSITDIASMDSDFDIYRRYRRGKFNQIFTTSR